jgi:ribosomal protein S18 acetylase RimI-like enzyme
MRLQFDPVCAADAETLLHMARAFHQEDGHPLDSEGEMAVAQIATGEPFARAWIVRQAGDAIGYVVLTLGYSIEYGGRDGFIDDLYLVPAVRGSGVGRQVLHFALSEATALGIKTLHLEVETGNESATRLYRSAGFEVTGRTLMRCHLKPEDSTTRVRGA